ncbi:zinc-dependent alcohol dehydrogenase family protein [Saccharopolyspora gloriosae]|uniref:zinc-dependent alcohol dehydrogenase family protein n=1 Tax=Saccharopolyspora gloriosae TaxID=455344 RepID=UPI001FB6A19A|nr:zinc-dependent alcohol dehydrogenase family protein [Saccharopolyspora gloriosae]
MPRLARFHQVGGPEVLQLDEVATPVPGRAEVLIETRALGLNRAEAAFRAGQYEEPVLPAGIGYEAAGIVRAVGEDVRHVGPGDAVSVIPAFGVNDYALHGESVLAPAHAVIAHPSGLSWAEAAAAWMMFTTAYGGLVDIAGIGEHDPVLIPAASSSVGIAAIQICNALGARPIALTRGSGKRQALLDAGAAEVIVTGEQQVAAEVHRLTGGQGARVVFDPVGGPGFADLTAAMAAGGIAVIYGALAAEQTPLPVGDVLGKKLTVRGYVLIETTAIAAKLAAAIEFIRHGLETGVLKPVISEIFDLDDIVAAHEHLESNTQLGKIVVRVPR